jgi:hypothetical protein
VTNKTRTRPSNLVIRCQYLHCSITGYKTGVYSVMMALALTIGRIEPYAIRDRSHLLEEFHHKMHWSSSLRAVGFGDLN